MQRRHVVTSLGILALCPSLTQAQANDEHEIWDLVVIGSGVAGLSAAVSAAQNGLSKVLILEKAPTLGGHSILSTGYMSAVCRHGQPQSVYEQEVDSMVHTMTVVGENLGSPSLIRKLVRESGDALHWLSSLGLVWSPNVYQAVAGITVKSYIPSQVRAGYDYVVTLNRAARQLGVSVRLSCRVTQLLDDQQGRIRAITFVHNATTQTIRTKSVVIATGGFGGNVTLRQRYDSRLNASFTTTASPDNATLDTATGDGITLASKVGAQLVDMQHIQILPFWGGRLTDYTGADIYLNHQGQRFVNEGGTWKHIAKVIWEQPDKTFWVVTDSQSSKGASRSGKLMHGTVKQAASIEEMAEGMGVDCDTLRQTLLRYNAFAAKGHDDDFGKQTFTQTIDKSPYYYGPERLYVHYCCGGLKFDLQSRVIGRGNSPIPGLFAAGEVTGGLHGADRVGGCSITDCVVFGRNAGREAARYVRLVL